MRLRDNNLGGNLGMRLRDNNLGSNLGMRLRDNNLGGNLGMRLSDNLGGNLGMRLSDIASRHKLCTPAPPLLELNCVPPNTTSTSLPLQPDPGYYYGFVFFRQVRDSDIRRGYFQKVSESW